jgi:excisionase family DNA binding protein
MTVTGRTKGKGPPPPRPVVPLLTVEEVCDILRISREKLYRLMRNGDLDWRRIGETRRIRSDDLARFIEREKGSGNGDV